MAADVPDRKNSSLISDGSTQKRLFDAIVIGGGIHGCSAAFHLSQRGLKCLLIEKGLIGSQASGVNAGGVRRIGRHPAELPLAEAGLQLWKRLPEVIGSDCGLKTVGHMFLAENEDDLVKIEHRQRFMRDAGFYHEETVTQGDVRQLVEGVSRHILGGLIARGDGYASPYHTVCAFSQAARRNGVDIQEKTPVVSIKRLAGTWQIKTHTGALQAPYLINCAGSWGASFSAATGDPVPLKVEAPMMMVTAPFARYNGPVLGRVQGRFSFKAGANGSVLIGGGQRASVAEDGMHATLDVSGLSRSAATVRRILPRFANARMLRAWYGLEGYLPDGLPVIGPSTGGEGLFHAFGFSGHGFQLGPIVGQVIADLVVGGSTDLPIADFRIDRFDTAPAPLDVWASSGLASPTAHSLRAANEVKPKPKRMADVY